LLSLPTSDAATSVVDTLLPALHPGDTIIDTTTGSPGDMIRLGDQLASSRVAYLDATIAASSSQVSRGEALVLVGGDMATLENARDVFATFAAEVIHVGPCGAGAKAKLVHNLVLGLNRAVLAEGLALARTLGLDLETMLTMLRSSPAVSRVVEIKGPRMIQGRFEPEARVAQHLKDVRLILETAEASGGRVPLSREHARLLAEAVAAGWGELDNSAIFRVFEVAEKDASRDQQ
jgi:3-hydroxyisobutyrate dehydrogenase-like beta-hydroxyacid dehydrogenase